MEFKKGSWTVEEDSKLFNYITIHGEGSWNSVAQFAGLNRSGKSCRLRWLNYLRPDVRRGNLTLQEQFLILHLHCCWGNRWSKIAQQLPGRTDNEIKNYWRTRIQKQANQLKCDVNSNEFRDTIRFLLLPRLVDQIQAAAASSSTAEEPSTTSTTATGTGTISIHDDSPTYYMTVTTTTTTTAPGHIVVSDPASENETETSMASSHTHLLEDHLVFPDVTDFTDCDDVIVMANNWPVGFTDGLVSGPTFASSSACCEQDRFDGGQALDYYGNAWFGGGGGEDTMLNDDDDEACTNNSFVEFD